MEATAHRMADLNATSSKRPSRLRPYPKYKDSGVEWLGEIPAHWPVHQFKRICRLPYGDSLSSDARVAGIVPVMGSNGRVGSHTEANTEAPCIVIGRKGSFGKLNYSIEPTFAIDTTFFVDHRFTSAHIRWLFFLLNSLHLDHMTKDSAVPGLGREDVYGLLVPIPSPAEQYAIADFLDTETDKVDELIAKQERLIDLLREERTALISRAVTGGLGVDVPMKDSGIEWLGEIPAHWEAQRVKWVARMESGHTPNKKVDAYWTDGDIPWVSLNDTRQLKQQDHIHDTAYYTNQLGLENSSARLLPPRAVILSRDATIGLAAITERSMAVSQHFIAWICNETVLPEYLLRVFDAMQGELVRLTMGATLRTIGMPDVGALTTPIPPVPEQERIVAFVRRETAAIDGLITKAQQAIERLEEFRTALISAAVTGQIDVREIAA